MQRRRRSRATTLALTLAILVGIGLGLMRDRLVRFGGSAWIRHGRAQAMVEVPPGATADDVARLLERQGIIGDARLFSRWLRFVAKKADKLQAGTFELSPAMTPEELVEILAAGPQPEVRVTIPEGFHQREVARRLADAGLSSWDDLLAAMQDPETLTAFGVPAMGAGGQKGVPGGLEGYLFPDTYRFAKNATPRQILRRMRNRLDEVLDARLRARMQERGLDLHTVLTLASLVEKETGARHERPRIAAVFFNRLARGMRLQTDPTVLYGVEGHDGDIKGRDLRRDHPYNTYVIRGLPPGPIAQPGLAAIKAVLWPARTEELFFVARGNLGDHEFCPTLACHNDAVRRWQRGGQGDDGADGSTPGEARE